MQDIEESKSLDFEDYWLYIDVTASVILTVLAEILGQHFEHKISVDDISNNVPVHYDYNSIANSFIVGNLLGVLRHWWYHALSYNLYELTITCLLMKTALELRVAAYAFAYIEFAVTRLLETHSFSTIYSDWQFSSSDFPRPDPPLLYLVTFLGFRFMPEELDAIFGAVMDFLVQVKNIVTFLDAYSYSPSLYSLQ